jgi:hypothetical protein
LQLEAWPAPPWLQNKESCMADSQVDSADENDFDEQVTQPLAFALSLERAATTRASSVLFRRVAAAFELSEAGLETLLYEGMVCVGATPETLGADDVWALRAHLFELSSCSRTPGLRDRSRAALELLMFEIAPAETT